MMPGGIPDLWGRLQPARGFSPAYRARRTEVRRRLKPAPQSRGGLRPQHRSQTLVVHLTRLAVVLLLCSGLLFAEAATARVSRASLLAVERSFDARVERIDPADAFYLLGNTRGIYLEGYGAVFTAEINLVASATVSPFRPAFTKKELASLRQKKTDRIIVLKEQMRSALIAAGAGLDQVPPHEQVVFGVSIFYFNWEDSAGLPRQVIMQAPRKVLVEANKGNTAQLEAAVRVQEF